MAKSNVGKAQVIEIMDKLFMSQVIDIYKNPKSYLGKTIKLQGIFEKYIDEGHKIDGYYVFRYGSGCCQEHEHSVVGFEVRWNGKYPNDGDWVEAVGNLENYEKDDNKILRIELFSLNILKNRGEEFVLAE